MVETIAPVVHGGRNRSYWRSYALYLGGTTLSGAAFGALLGALGSVLAAPWGRAGAIALAAIALLYSARELLRLPIPLPDLDRQVPDWWRTFFSKETAAFLYGIGLGIGILTFLSFGTYVAIIVASVASGDPLAGALLCGLFGLARGLSILVAPSDESGERVQLKLEELARTNLPRAVNGSALLLVAGAAAVSA